MADAVLTEKRDRVLIITLNRPEAMNAINSALGEGLVAALAQLDDERSTARWYDRKAPASASRASRSALWAR